MTIIETRGTALATETEIGTEIDGEKEIEADREIEATGKVEDLDLGNIEIKRLMTIQVCKFIRCFKTFKLWYRN